MGTGLSRPFMDSESLISPSFYTLATWKLTRDGSSVEYYLLAYCCVYVSLLIPIRVELLLPQTRKILQNGVNWLLSQPSLSIQPRAWFCLRQEAAKTTLRAGEPL